MTIGQIIDCIETYLSPEGDHNTPPTIQGRLVSLDWDQKAKPTPLLVLEQLNDGSNVTIRSSSTRRAISSHQQNAPDPSSGQRSTGTRSRASATSAKSRSSRSSSKSSR